LVKNMRLIGLEWLVCEWLERLGCEWLRCEKYENAGFLFRAEFFLERGPAPWAKFKQQHKYAIIRELSCREFILKLKIIGFRAHSKMFMRSEHLAP
jgi:hypothetical protein